MIIIPIGTPMTIIRIPIIRETIRIPMIRILTIRIMIGIPIQKAVGYASFLSYLLAKRAPRFKNGPARFS